MGDELELHHPVKHIKSELICLTNYLYVKFAVKNVEV